MELTVVIINFNVKFFLEQCLLSVRKAMKSIEGEIIVVDNCSTDDSMNFLPEKFKDVQFIWNNENIGFAKANNQAIKLSKGDYILILNPDTLVPEDCFKKCIDFLKSKNNLAALGIKMIDGAGHFLKESKRAFPSPLTSFFKLTGFASLFPRSPVFSKYHLGFLDNNLNHEVDVLAGAFIMVPRSIINETGGFDEDFFMYGEDVDLSYRIQKAGFKNYYFSESAIIHFKGESTKKGSLNYVKMFYSAMSIFVKKHYGDKKAWLFNFFIQTAIWIRAGISAIFRFLKWVGLPVIDGILILAGFIIAKKLVEVYLGYNLGVPQPIYLMAYPVLTFLFMISAYFSGLYDNGFKQSKLNLSVIIAIPLILSVYAILPTSYNYSRLVLIAGSLFAYLLLSLVRIYLLKSKTISHAASDDTIQTLIVGNQNEFNKVKLLLKTSGAKRSVLQRITINHSSQSLKMIPSPPKLVSENEIIFCEGELSFKEVIELLPGLPAGFGARFYARGGRSIIGSNSKDVSGEYISVKQKFNLSDPHHRRFKCLLDILTSFLFLITFPVHFFTKKNTFSFFKHAIQVLFQKKTWVGYALNEPNLPPIKQGIVTVTGYTAALNKSPVKTLSSLDYIYAKHYNVAHDFKIVWSQYKYLS
ncbi:MAG: glycosyltransferase [Ginsengibacter sp.]